MKYMLVASLDKCFTHLSYFPGNFLQQIVHLYYFQDYVIFLSVVKSIAYP